MKKGLLLLFAVAAAFAVATQSIAGGSRLGGMSADARITEDQSLVFMYPNKALEYSNLVDIHLGSVAGGFIGDEWGGFMMKEDDLGVLGVYANRPGAASSMNPFFLGALEPSSVELFWAKDFDGVNFGAQLLYAGSRQHSSDLTVQDYGVNVGLGFTSDAFSQINLHASFSTASLTFGGFDATGAPIVLSGGALLQKDIDNDHYMRLFGDVRFASNDLFTNLIVTDSSSIGWDLGIGCTKKVNGGKALISSGLIVTEANSNLGNPSINYLSSTVVLWNTSVEATVNSWLVVRTGFSKNLYDSAIKVTDAPFNFTTGASVMWQNFTLDLNINPASLETLFGNPEVGGGIFYPSSNNQGLFQVASADLSYKF
jgi:hypothetical protein